jgi:hypothetical protein
LGEQGKDAAYPFCEFVVARKEADGTLTNLVSNPKELDVLESSGSRTVFPTRKKKLTLTKGEYVVRVKVQMKDQKNTKFVFSTYSAMKVEVREIPAIQNFYRYMLVNDFKKTNPKKEITHNCNTVSGYSGLTSFIGFENKDPFKKLRVEIKMLKLENMKLGKAFRVSFNQFKVEVLPGKIETVYLKKLDIGRGQQYSYDMSVNWA